MSRGFWNNLHVVLRPNHVMMFVVGEQFLWPQFVKAPGSN